MIYIDFVTLRLFGFRTNLKVHGLVSSPTEQKRFYVYISRTGALEVVEHIGLSSLLNTTQPKVMEPC